MRNSKPLLHLKAAAEIELRRRQKERAASCFMCELDGAIDEVYELDPDPEIACSHEREQQEIDSQFCQNMISNLSFIYGDELETSVTTNVLN